MSKSSFHYTNKLRRTWEICRKERYYQCRVNVGLQMDEPPGITSRLGEAVTPSTE
jgi:hypothetical protein